MTGSYKIGLIAAPEFAEKLTKKLIKKLPNSLKKHISNQVEWTIDYKVDPMTGAAETIEEIFTKAKKIKKENDWDYIVCLTDLPIFHEKKVVAADINEDKGVILLSLPAFGWGPLLKQIQHAIIYTFKDMDNSQSNKDEQSEQNLIWRKFPISPVQRIKIKLTETSNMHIRYLVYPRLSGDFRLLLGMTFANNPFKMMSSLTGVIAIAFTTGGFGLIFTTMWKLSHLFSNWRLSGITIVAIVGMSIWVMIAHELWEPVKTSSHKKIRRLYNLTTISTLLISVTAYYFVVFILFFITSQVIIPPGLLGKTLELNESAALIDYLKIAWFAASLSTMTGAIGVGLENETIVRNSTYGYRQRSRYKEMIKNDSANNESKHL